MSTISISSTIVGSIFIVGYYISEIPAGYEMGSIIYAGEAIFVTLILCALAVGLLIGFKDNVVVHILAPVIGLLLTAISCSYICP